MAPPLPRVPAGAFRQPPLTKDIRGIKVCPPPRYHLDPFQVHSGQVQPPIQAQELEPKTFINNRTASVRGTRRLRGARASPAAPPRPSARSGTSGRCLRGPGRAPRGLSLWVLPWHHCFLLEERQRMGEHAHCAPAGAVCRMHSSCREDGKGSTPSPLVRMGREAPRPPIRGRGVAWGGSPACCPQRGLSLR